MSSAISEWLLDIVKHITESYKDLGFQLFKVGGAVRDSLLGVSSNDLDFATSAPPDVTREVLKSIQGASVYDVGEKFGTVGCVYGDYDIEITTFRSEVYTGGSRKPEVKFGVNLQDDLARRDFTFNAIACDPLTDNIVDPFGGVEDLKLQIIRAVGNPKDRFQEDPLRMLRAIRFMSQLGFSIEIRTFWAMKESADQLKSISRERIAEEWNKVLVGDFVVFALNNMIQTRLLQTSISELYPLYTDTRDQGKYHHLPLWEHTMQVVQEVPADLTLRWSALLHDIGKVATRTEDTTGIHFLGHEDESANIATQILRSLKASNELVNNVTLLVKLHMQVNQYQRSWRIGTVRRLAAKLGDQLDRAILLAKADNEAHTITDSGKFDDFANRIKNDVPLQTLQSPLNGNDIMAIAQRDQPGPWIKSIKQQLTELVVEGQLDPNNKEEASRLVLELLTFS